MEVWTCSPRGIGFRPRGVGIENWRKGRMVLSCMCQLCATFTAESQKLKGVCYA